MKKLLCILSIFIFLFSISPAFALYGNYDEFVSDILPEQNTPAIIPKGSFFRGLLGENVSSEFNNNGDKIKILINSDFVYDNKVVIPKNSLFIGMVNNLEKAQQGRNGYFSIDIIGIVFPDGRQYSAKGYVVASKNERIFGGEFARRSSHKTTLHRSACFGGRGSMELLQNGPRIMGKETFLRTGSLVTIIIEEQIDIGI